MTRIEKFWELRHSTLTNNIVCTFICFRHYSFSHPLSSFSVYFCFAPAEQYSHPTAVAVLCGWQKTFPDILTGVSIR